MIHLFRKQDSSYADEVEERLQGLVLAHEVHVEESDGGDEFPLVREGGKEYRGLQEINGFLEEISDEVMTGRSMQSDTCVRDPDNPSACL